MPGALALVTLNVTGPAATEVLSSLQPSLPPSLARVTLTVLTLAAPPPFDAAVLDELLAESVLDPHAVAASAAAARSAGVASHALGDTEVFSFGLLAFGFFTIVLSFPFVLRGGAAPTRRGKQESRGTDRENHWRP
jgi:hypothetical protein